MLFVPTSFALLRCVTSARGSAALSLACMLLVGGPSAVADDWNTGPGGNSRRTSLSKELGPSSPSILWEGSLAAQVAQQAVTEGNTVVMARMTSLSDTQGGTTIIAQNLTTGAERWSRQLPVDFPVTDWRSRVSAIRDGRVFATRAGNTNMSYLYALDAEDGHTLWRSEALVDESSTESVVFHSSGDPIVGNFSSLTRINALDGTTVWSVSRTCPTSNGCEAAVHNDSIYIWEASAAGPRVTAFAATDGARQYSTPGIGGGFIQQLGVMVGPDGTVYAPRTQNNPITDFFVAFTDTGSGFDEKWRVPMGYVPFASHGVGPDGSVYTYAPTREILRLDPSDGHVLNMSEPIVSDFHQPRIAIGSGGTIYFTNGGFSGGRLYSFDADLTPRWSVPVPNVNVGGPALGENGVLIVCGVGTDVRAFFTEPAPPPCPCDWNTDMALNSQDFFDFLAAFFAGNADFNDDSMTNSQDFFDFLSCFFTGC
ncbi:MAG: PQQ-like beta-propeller repeat protein [Pyrinomonadaceae bacterium]|nr:PQQ-like beta-propeller repeat protein [Phycisphaerales bacterium]